MLNGGVFPTFILLTRPCVDADPRHHPYRPETYFRSYDLRPLPTPLAGGDACVAPGKADRGEEQEGSGVDRGVVSVRVEASLSFVGNAMWRAGTTPIEAWSPFFFDCFVVRLAAQISNKSPVTSSPQDSTLPRSCCRFRSWWRGGRWLKLVRASA